MSIVVLSYIILVAHSSKSLLSAYRMIILCMMLLFLCIKPYCAVQNQQFTAAAIISNDPNTNV